MAQSHASSSLTQLLKDKNNARNIEVNAGTSTNNNTTTNINRSDSQNMESTQSLSVNSNGFSQSFITNNNAHTAVFGSSFNMSSSPMTLNSNNSIGTINTHKSFAQKNYPSLSSSIPYSVPNSNTSDNSNSNEDGNAYNNNSGNSGNSGSNSTGNAFSGSSGSGSSLENYSGLMPSNIQQINSNVIQSPKVSNVEARFVITKQKLQEKQQQSASYHKSISPANASSYGSNASSNSAGSNSSKTINHASSFNKKMSSSSFTGGSGVGFASSSGSAGQGKNHTRSRSGSLSSQLGNLFFNSSSPSNTKSASSSSASMASSSFSFSSNSNSTSNSSASKTQSKLTSSLRNSNSALYMNGNSGTNNTNTNSSSNSNNDYGPNDNYNNGSSIQYEKTIEEQPFDDNDGSSSVSKPMRARQSNIYSASRTPVGSLHVNTSATSSSFTSSSLANNVHKGPEVSSPATPHSLKNSHSNSIAKFFRKSSSSSAMSSPSSSSSFSSPHGNAGHANNNNNNKGGSAYNANFSSNNHYSSSPSVSTFNTNAIVNGKNSNGNVNSAASSSLSKHYQENGKASSSSSSSNSTIVDNEQQHSFTSSTFNGPSSLGNTDILYQASNSSHPPPSFSSSSQQQQQQKIQQLAQQSNLPFHKRYLKTGDDLGAGAGGTVKVVKRLLDNEVFAVKEFRSKYDNERKRDYIKKITGEYCIGSTLKHPNIIATIEIVYDENRIFQVMEYCDYDLFAIVMSNKMSYDEICCCFKQILNGVEYLHSIGLSHRDLKLDNCVVDKNGIVKLIDFGASVVFSYPFSKNLVTASGIVGSDPYLAPEVCIFTKYDPRPVDIWSTAMIFVCMILKKFPWKIPKLRDSSFKLFCSGRDCDSLSQLVTRTPNPPNYEESVTEPTGGAGKSAEDNHNPKDPKNLNIGPQRLLHNLPEESQHIIGRMVDLAPACRANIDEIMSDPWVESIKMCYVDEHGQIICPDNSHHHTDVDQSVAHIAGLEKNKAQK